MNTSEITFESIEKKMLSMPRFQDVGARAARFGIDQIAEFCTAIGNPQRSIRTIHVAGTNGKGTVCSIIASLLKEAGFKTGLYTSPHLNEVRERFRIDGTMISKERMIEFFVEHQVMLEKYPLTFFELTTAMAFWIFKREQVDFSVIETGLGGRLDATNIITPEVCVITSIGMDHMEQLGNTLESIAFEKAGILKKGVPFVVGELINSADQVISKRAEQIGATKVASEITVKRKDMATYEIHISGNTIEVHPDLNTPKLDVNISMAVKAVSVVAPHLVEKKAILQAGCQQISRNSGLIGRFERLHPSLDWFYDGGHNPQALKELMIHMRSMFPGKKMTAIVSLMTDKITPDLTELLSQFDTIYYHEMDVQRAWSLNLAKESVKNVTFIQKTGPETTKTLKYLKSELVLFTGSFYFYSTVTEWMESLSLDSKSASQ
jgi:dihydrofolate synthase / folylpolyglutamate synthase